MTIENIALYQCDICKQKYTTAVEAYDCEAKGIEFQRHEIGDIVAIKERYPADPAKPFVKRKIVDVREGHHIIEYQLNELVQVGKSLWVGWSGLVDDSCIYATHEYMYRLNQKINNSFDLPHLIGQTVGDCCID